MSAESPLTPERTTPPSDPAPAEPAAQAAGRPAETQADLDPDLPDALRAGTAPDGPEARGAAANAATSQGEPARRAASVPEVLPATIERAEPGTGLGFWRRIRMRRAQRLGREEARDGRLEDIRERVGTLEKQIGAVEGEIALRFDRMEQRFTQFWEMEEQLGQLREIQDRLDEIRKGQEGVVEAAGQLRRTVRTCSLFVAVAGLAAVASLAAWWLGA